MMNDLARLGCTMFAGLVLMGPVWPASGSQGRDGAQGGNERRRPSLSLTAMPTVGASPLRVRANVEIRGGSNDYRDFYCPAIEWEWGDGSVSESESDCAPYEAGKSTIQRRYSAEHLYRGSGNYRLIFRLKQNDRAVAAANANITVRGGLDDFGR